MKNIRKAVIGLIVILALIILFTNGIYQLVFHTIGQIASDQAFNFFEPSWITAFVFSLVPIVVLYLGFHERYWLKYFGILDQLEDFSIDESPETEE